MKKILLFSLIFILIPSFIIFVFIVEPLQKEFKFTKNTMVRVYRSSTKVVEEVILEEYIMGVVAGEMPISFSEEALKAQAVAARSYIMYKILHNKKKDYDVVDTVLNQVYVDDTSLRKKWGKKYNEYKAKIQKVVQDTAYEYITYKGEIADALFFSTSGGYTENSEEIFSTKLHYLQSVKSDWDKISPVFSEQVEFSYKDFCNRLGISYTNKLSIKIIEKTTGGKINKIKINNKIYSGSSIVKALGLRTSNFSITPADNIIVTMRGYGHGVGMSQYGAEGMARAGYKYDEILKYYYTDIKIEKIK